MTTISRAARAELRAFWRRRPLRPDTVFLESFDGNGALDNPEAVFRALVVDPEFASLRFIWSLRAGHATDAVATEFGRDRRVGFVEPDSASYDRAVSTSRFIVTNATLPRWFSRRDGQTVLNTWHGTPVKRMGFDIDDQPARVANVFRNFLHADFVLSGSGYMTDTMYRRAHRLDGVFGGVVLEAGSPRMDRQMAARGEGADARQAAAETRRALADAGFDLGDRRVVLFAPTWKGTNFLRPDDASVTLRQARELQDLLGSDHLVVLKAHQAVHDQVAGATSRGLLVPNDLPTNAVLAVTDHLVTDYSSIWFDFLPMRRPIHYFVPDIETYDGYRGLYLDPSTWPGRVSTDLDALATDIRAPDDAEVAARAEAARLRFTADEDGHSTERVIAAVFRGDDSRTRAVRLDMSARPRRLLLVGGPPGRWDPTRADDAIERIDLDAVDVTVLVSDSRIPAYVAWQNQLDRRVRVVVRQGALGGSKIWSVVSRMTGRRPRSQLREEWRRLFSTTRFDSVETLTGDDFWVQLGRAAETGPI